MKIQIGEIIKNLRKKRGLTQGELAEILAVTAQSVSRWENGQSYPDIEQLPMIAEYFDITVDELMGHNPDTREELIRKYRELEREGYGFRENELKMHEVILKLTEKDPVGFCPDLFRIAKFITLHRNPVDASVLEEAREVCRKTLRECSDEYRPLLLSRIVLLEDEDKLINWQKFITSDVSLSTWDDILLNRYFALRTENHLWEAQMNKVTYNHIHAAVWTMANDKAGICQKINSQIFGYLHDEVHYRKVLSFINLFNARNDEKFLDELVFVKIRLMAVLTERGRIDEGAALLPEIREHLCLLAKKASGKCYGAVQDAVNTWMRREFDGVREDRRFREFFTFAKSISNPPSRSMCVPNDGIIEEFDMTDWIPLLETAYKTSEEAREKCDFSQYPTAIVLKAVSERIYTTVTNGIHDDSKERELLEKLHVNGDTHIEKMIFMHVDIGAVDMFRFAGEIAKLDKRNHSTELLLPGAEQYIKRTLEQVYGKDYFN